MDYYNEFDAYPAQWLRNLQAAGYIPNGRVDERSIADVKAEDLEGVRSAHFFAGVGGWPLALRLAGWSEDQEVWTGSCPCQPFSVAGARKGTKDKRHLWPEFFRLIRERRPPIVFGEQVASADGRNWLAGVRADLEGLGYAVGAADLCAAGTGEEGEGWFLRGGSVHLERTLIGAPHIRQRLYWVAYAKRDSGGTWGPRKGPGEGARSTEAGAPIELGRRRNAGRMAYREDEGQSGGLRKRKAETRRGESWAERRGTTGGVDDASSQRADVSAEAIARGYGKDDRLLISPSSSAGSLGHAISTGSQASESEVLRGAGRREERGAARKSSRPSSYWSSFDVLPCRDGKARRVESGTFPLAHGIPARVGKLRAYGNAIVPEAAATFIEAVLDILSPR